MKQSDHYDGTQIVYLDEYGTKAELNQFMAFWAAQKNPEPIWTALAQRITSGKVKAKRSTRTADRDDKLRWQIAEYLHDNPDALQKQALLSVLDNHPEVNYEQLKKVWGRCDQNWYRTVSILGDIDTDLFDSVFNPYK